MEEIYRNYIMSSGITKGDIIDVGSDLLSIMIYFREKRWKFVPELLIDALQDVVGQEGTILIRTFNWDFCHGVPFNYKTTPSQVGSLGNVALKREDFKRTRHALYSWCVWGKHQRDLVDMDPKDSFGDDSVFAFLEKEDAILLRIGDVQVSCLTSLHRSEQRAGIPFRFIKEFTGEYIDSNGIMKEKSYSMFVRNLDYNIRVREEIMNQNFLSRGVVEFNDYDGMKISKINLKKAGETVYQDILRGKWDDWVECTIK